jgi:glycosyltransferase involved in cell wall biosynthesis
MRIVYLSGSHIPSRRANSIHVMRMCEAFARNGHQMTLIGKQSEADYTGDPYDFYGVERNFDLALMPWRKVKGINILLLPKLCGQLRRYDPREVLIYARDIYGASIAIRMGFRVIYEAHALPYSKLIRYLETALFGNRRLLRLVVISESLKDLFLSRFDIADRIVACHDAAGVPNGSWNGDLPWPSCRDTLQIGYTGHLYPGRGVEIIIECAKRLPQHDFHIIGGTETDIAFWKVQAGVNAHFHGFLLPALVHHARARCDVLLMPYQKVIVDPGTLMNTAPWMSPLKLFEYMASRKAIIASDLTVLREVLDERMAMLVSPDDTDRWVAAIQRCEDRRFRQSLAENAYNAFAEDYTWDKRARKVLEGIGV